MDKMAASVEEVVGMAKSWGKNSMACAMCSLRVRNKKMRWQWYCSGAAPMYQPSTPYGAQVPRFSGVSCRKTMVPGGASGVLL